MEGLECILHFCSHLHGEFLTTKSSKNYQQDAFYANNINAEPNKIQETSNVAENIAAENATS